MLKFLALETIEQYPPDAIRVYTDGSEDDGGSGYGVLIEYPYAPRIRESGSCGRYRSNYEAEVVALHRALTLLEQATFDASVFPEQEP